MEQRYTAFISTISNASCDFLLDIAINKYNLYQVLFYTSLIAGIFQLALGKIVGIEMLVGAIPYVILYGIAILFGYIFYVKALERLPIGLAALLESGNVFIILIIDIIIGSIKITPYFILMLILFILAIGMFAYETNRTKKEITFKNIKLTGLIFLGLSIFLYSMEPYLIKVATTSGANEIAINLSYSMLAIPYFLFQYRKSKKIEGYTENKNRKKVIILCVSIGIFEALYYFFGTISFANDTPFIVSAIMELRVFLLIIVSAIFRTDKLTWKKVVAMLLGVIAVLGIYQI